MMSGKDQTKIRKAVGGNRKTGKTGMQTYRFEFCGDEKAYSVTFGAKITKKDVSGILEALQNQLYENCGGAILAYLDQHCLEYSGFKTSVLPLEHEEAMHWGEYLLRSCQDGYFDSPADNYYAVIDHQKWTSEDCCEGCYCALARILDGRGCHCRITGQIFSCDRCGDNQNGYFAVRVGENGHPLHDADAKAGEPVLPVFGCVDMVWLLLNIDSIDTASQAVKISVR